MPEKTGNSIGNITVGVDVELNVANKEAFASQVQEAAASGQANAGSAKQPRDVAPGGGAPGKTSVDADVKVKGSDIIKSIQAALDSHEFKLLIDQTHLRNQIETALKGLEIPLGLAAGQPRQAVAAVAAPREVPPEVSKAFNQVKAFPGAASELFDELQSSFKAIGKKFSTLPNTASGVDKTVEIISQLGGSLEAIYEPFRSKPGAIASLKKAATVVEQTLGVSGDSAKNIAQLVSNFKQTGAAALPVMRPFAASTRSTAPIPVSIAHEDRVAAKTRASAEAEQKKVERLEIESRSTLAPIRPSKPFEVGDLARAARGAATTGGPSVAALVAAGLAGETNLGDLLSSRRPVGRRGQATAFGREAGRLGSAFGPGLPGARRGEDPAAEMRALDQLGLRGTTINWGALRQGTGPAAPDFRSLAALAARGDLSNFVRNPKTGQFTRIEPGGVEGTAERAESEERIRTLLKGRGQVTVPGVEGRVKPQSPMDIIKSVANELYGAEGTQFLDQPRVQVELKKAIRQGSALKQMSGIQTGGFAHIPGATPSSILAGIRDEVAAEQAGTGIDRETARIASLESAAENRERVAAGFGLNPAEAAKRKLEEVLPRATRMLIEGGSLPDFTKIPEAIMAEVEAGNFTGGRQSFASARIRQVKQLLLKGGGPDLTAEQASKTLGIPVSEEQAVAFQNPIPNARRLAPLISATFGSLVGGIEPGPGRKAIGLNRSERAKSFATQDVDIADRLTGRGVLVPMANVPGEVVRGEGGMNAPVGVRTRARPTTELDLEKQRLVQEQQKEARDIATADFEAEQARRKTLGATPVRATSGGRVVGSSPKMLEPQKEVKTPQGITNLAEGFTSPEDFLFQIDRRGRKSIRPSVRARTSQTGRLTEIAQAQAEADAILKGFVGLPTLTPGVGTEVQQRREGGDLRAGRSIGKNATGDDLRRAAARTATVAGPVATKDVRPVFDEFNAALGGAGGGRGTGRGAVPPGGSGGRFNLGDAVVKVNIVESIPLTISGGGVGAGKAPSTMEGAAHGAAFDFKFGRASLFKQTSPSAQQAFGRDVARLRDQLGLEDAQIKKLAGKAGLGLAAEAFFPDEAIPGGGGSGTGAGGLSPRALNRIRAGVGLGPAALINPEQNEADVFRAREAAELRKLERQIPKRSFGPSLTDLLTNMGGFLDKSVEAIDTARREAGQLATVRAQGVRFGELGAAIGETRTAVQGRLEGLQAERAGAIAGGATPRSAAVKDFDRQIGVVTKSLKVLDAAYADNQASVEANKAVQDAQTTVFQRAKAAVPGVPTRLAGFGVAGIAAGASFAITSTIIQVVGQIMSAITAGIEPAIDRAAGSPAVTSQITRDIAAAGAPGTFRAALAQQTAQAGIGPQGFEGVLGRGEAIAGNAALIRQFDLIRAEQNIARGNQGLPAGMDRSLTQATGGLFGTGVGITGLGDFQLSTQQIVAESLKNLPAFSERTTARENVFGNQTPQQIEEFLKAFPDAQPRDYIPPSLFKEGSEALRRFNKDVKDGGSNLRLVFAESVGKTSADVDKFAASLESVGAKELAAIVREKGLVFEGGPSTGAAGLQALQAAQRSAAGFDVESLLQSSEPARRAQEQLRQQRIRQAQNDIIPGQFGIQNALNPLPSTEQLQGLLPGQDISGTTAIFNEVKSATSEAVQGAKDFVATNLPGFGDKFAASLDKAAGYAQRINDIQIGVQVEQAKLSADKYAYSITIANRSLRDAKGLTGEIKNANEDNLGVLERQQFLLGRQAQSLSIGLSQLQINFQKAVAGFVAPGATPEERAARIKEAEKEAAIAQEQLDIQKAQFALGGKTFTISASRQVRDLEQQIKFLTRDYQLQLHSAQAQEDIKGLSKLLDVEAQRANELFNEAVAAQNDVFALEAQMVAATGKHLREIEKIVLQSFYDTYNGMVQTINGTVLNSGTSGTGGGGRPALLNAEGALFNTTGATSMIAGEAGTETVAILRNPRSMLMPSGGTGDVFNIYVSGNKFSTEEDERRLVSTLTTEIQRQMGRNASLYGLRRPS